LSTTIFPEALQPKPPKRLKFAPSKFSGDPACRSEIATRHRPMGAGEFQGDLLAVTEAVTRCIALGVVDARALFRVLKRELLGPEPAGTEP